MGWHLDGRVLGVVGTHTHVPTADARVLPGGTAYVTDVGMTGSRAGVIGVKKEQALERFITQLPVKFETADEDPWVMGCLIESGDGGLASSIELVMTAGRLDRPRGVERRRPRRTTSPEQRDQDEREEPDDVEIEPVRQRRARARSAPPRRAPPPEAATSGAGRTRPAAASATAEHLDQVLNGREALLLSPDAEGRVAAELKPDRAVPETRRARRPAAPGSITISVTTANADQEADQRLAAASNSRRTAARARAARTSRRRPAPALRPAGART